MLCRRRGSQQVLHVGIPPHSTTGDNSSFNSSEDENGDRGSYCPALTEGTTSAGEWIGITTNSEDCSVSSEMDEHPFASEFHTVRHNNLSFYPLFQLYTYYNMYTFLRKGYEF